jgi:hypothetical protein
MSKYHSDDRLGVHLVYLQGHIRKDYFGRIVVDQCISDEEHLKNGITYEGEDRVGCRVILDDLFERLVGKTGRIWFENVEFDEGPAEYYANKTLTFWK